MSEFILLVLGQAAGGFLAMLAFQHNKEIKMAFSSICRSAASLFSHLANWAERKGLKVLPGSGVYSCG